MASDSSSECSIPTLPPAIPTGMEAALGVPLLGEAVVVQADNFELENNTFIAATQDSDDGPDANDRRAMKMPEFWQAVAKENDLASAAQARSVVGTALRLATTQAREYGSFRMGSYAKFTRVKRGRELISVDISPLAKLQKYAQ